MLAGFKFIINLPLLVSFRSPVENKSNEDEEDEDHHDVVDELEKFEDDSELNSEDDFSGPEFEMYVKSVSIIP